MATTLVGVVSMIIGIILTHILSRYGQANQWTLEQRRLEGRELIGAITEHYDAIMYYLAPSIAKNVPVKADDQCQLDDARRKALRALRDRIYLASDVKQGNLLKRWIEAFHALKEGDDSESVNAFQREYEDLCDLIVKAARQRGRF
jgi:hypothetical protein